MKEWKISGIGTLAYEYEDGELLQVYSEASLHAYLEGIVSEEGVSEERKWLEEGLALLNGVQKMGRSNLMRIPTLAWTIIAAYRSEINYSISCYWDEGWTLKLGDELNGFRSSSVYETVEDLQRDMPKEICRLYPKSKFAKEYLEQRGVITDDLAKQLCEDKAIEKEAPQNQHDFEGWPPSGD